MSDEPMDFSALLERYSGLGRADRKAVLESMDAEDRIAFENAIAAEVKSQEEEDARQRQADRQFLGYSPWLAAIVEGAVKHGDHSLTPETAKAVAAEHTSLIASQSSNPRDGWRGALDRLQEFFTLPSEPAK